jgi:hypothetical protein
VSVHGEIRQRYFPERDEWVFESSGALALTKAQLKVAAHEAAKIMADRYRGMRPGPRRDMVGKAHDALRAGRYRQGFLGRKSDTVLYSH